MSLHSKVVYQGITYDVTVNNPDLCRWDETRARKNWPSAQDAPVLWMTFISWAAMTRKSAFIQPVSFEQFRDEATEVEFISEDSVEVNPTLSAALPVELPS